MQPVRFLRRAPIRLALFYSVVFLLAYSSAAAVAFYYLQSNLTARLDRLVFEKYSNITHEQIDGDGDGDGDSLVTIVNTHVQISANNANVFLLRGADGNTLAGNVTSSEGLSGYATRPGTALGRSESTSYRILAGRVKDMQLLVGVSEHDTNQIRRFVFEGFGLASLAAILLSLSGAAWLAHRSQQRINAIADTIRAVSNGDLDVRLPVSPRQDDIDYISSEINVTLGELKSKMTALDTVSSNIAHDLKSPINRLFLDIETARQKAVNNENIVNDLDKARDELTGINRTFDSLLRIAKIEQKAQKALFMTLELPAFINDIVETYLPVFDDASMSLEVQHTERIPATINADRALLTQLMTNILENSLHYCSPGAQIKIIIHSTEKQASVTISDTGPGIPDDEKEKVFQRLYRIDKSRVTSGSGLGLSLVRAIAQLHGASIVLSDNHPGLIVTITFPLSRVSAR